MNTDANAKQFPLLTPCDLVHPSLALRPLPHDGLQRADICEGLHPHAVEPDASEDLGDRSLPVCADEGRFVLRNATRPQEQAMLTTREPHNKTGENLCVLAPPPLDRDRNANSAAQIARRQSVLQLPLGDQVIAKPAGQLLVRQGTRETSKATTK